MFRSTALLSFCLLAQRVLGQQVGTLTAETHPTLQVSECAAGGTCTSSSLPIVLDANWRWTHSTTGSTNCYTGNEWDATLCPDDTTCAANCALDGADYSGTYGISVSGDALTLKFVTPNSNGQNVGSRVYLMSSDTEYKEFNLLNQEFTFDVDMSTLPCGLNGALYFSQMDADGGMARFPTNKAGAKYGTGYCDSQCPRDIKYIDGEANVAGWNGTSTNSGTGSMGSCCSEMDIWEANTMGAAVTPHPCSLTEQTSCTGDDCGSPDRYAGVCDPDGCDFNSFRMGDESFLGPGLTIDTTQKITVVTQFITDDGTADGNLAQINRVYVQNGQVIQNSNSTIPGVTGNSITDDFCDAQKTAFGDTNDFDKHGGLAQMGAAFKAGMVLVLSIWDDYAVNMLWLDSTYPTTDTAADPGAARGNCSTTSGAPADVESSAASAAVIYSNIKYGPIGSTFSSTGTGTGGSSTASAPPTSTSSAAGAAQTKYGQCGGTGWTGPTACASGSTCTASNQYYSQCL
ncbi:uncharacterized protein STEHIDRAFT_148616 [Stereum hirsutum FP-91666 SS1]|uniref:uncharacterized protein n=1 Tax=Stereum hirsutum (strain FP-91666) TaxID=721885 RepID=UPI000444A804|nr:uncharacterized protein STEHIDRAFT_148616 [Stereum hirsutum FP-91666 SS1]EIM84171.1 hypothetical protein STEHIDRAFT_148616 [Stereum hirsutum FP-91666 SS1]